MSRQPDLADVICGAPVLLVMLSPTDRLAISVCNRQLRHVFRSSVQAITVDHDTEVVPVLEGSWPQLALIKVKAEGRPGKLSCFAPHSKFQLIALLHAMQHSPGIASALIVRPVSVPATLQHQPSQHIAAAFAHLHSSEWQMPSLRVITDTLVEEVIAQMIHSSSDWSSLRWLKLHNLSLAALKLLIRASWPQVRMLTLRNTQLDEDAMAALMSTSWPLLKELDIGPHPDLNTAAIATILAGISAAMVKLVLVDTKLDSACTHCVMSLPHHDQPLSLHLPCTSLDTDGMTQLFSMPWPQLQELVLVGNIMTADSAAELVSASMPNLEILILDESKLDAATARHIATGKWPKLLTLCLCNNHLDTAAMAHLAKGNWPLLSRLCLQGNDIIDLGLQLLMVGQWPQLQSLTLDSRLASSKVWGLLNLALSAMPSEATRQTSFVAARNITGPGIDVVGIVWPQLVGVHFEQTQSPALGARWVSWGQEKDTPFTDAGSSQGSAAPPWLVLLGLCTLAYLTMRVIK